LLVSTCFLFLSSAQIPELFSGIGGICTVQAFDIAALNFRLTRSSLNLNPLQPFIFLSASKDFTAIKIAASNQQIA